MSDLVKGTSVSSRGTLVNNGALGNQGVQHSYKSDYRGNVVKHKEKSKYIHLWSYQDRFDYGIEHGLTPENAKIWAQNQYTSVDDTFWSKAGAFFGGKLNSEKFSEQNELADTASFNRLLEAQREQEYNDPAAEAQRRSAAGINDSLTGGSELGTGDAGAVEDETIGAGLPEAMSSLNGEGSDFMKIAETLMNGATSVLGLVTSGVDVASAVQNLDSSALSNVLDISKKIIDQGFDPLSPQWNEFRDSEGNVNWSNYMRSLGIRSPRERKILQRLLSSQNRNAALEASSLGKRSDILSKYREYSEEFAKLKGYGIGAPAYTPTGYNNGGQESALESLVSNETYSKYVDNVAKFIQTQMEAQAEQEGYKADYFNALSGHDQAAADNALNKFKESQSKLKMSAAQQVNLQIQDLIKRSEAGDWMASLLLQSAISGSFNEFGLGNPMDLPKFGIEQVGKIAGDITNGLFRIAPTKSTIIKK